VGVIAIILGIALTITSFVYLLARAPFGWEDDRGFHFDTVKYPVDCASAPTRPDRSSRGGRLSETPSVRLQNSLLQLLGRPTH